MAISTHKNAEICHTETFLHFTGRSGSLKEWFKSLRWSFFSATFEIFCHIFWKYCFLGREWRKRSDRESASLQLPGCLDESNPDLVQRR